MIKNCLPALLMLLLLGGCTTPGRLDLARQTGGNAALFQQVQAYNGRTGEPLAFVDVAERCADADVILFGEMHNDSICNQYQAQLLAECLRQRRSIALAMEFFEADTQATLAAYLRERLPEDEFRELARQSRRYARSHRPLIELCRAAQVPVLAANAPRRLVRAYRLSGVAYPEFRAQASPEDRRWLPRESSYLVGPYEDRFFEIMGAHDSPGPDDSSAAPQRPTPPPQEASDAGESGDDDEIAETEPDEAPAADEAVQAEPDPPAVGESVADFYRAQLLWDDAMAETVADHRAARPGERVMLMVGRFHVAYDGGTVAKLRQRRPADELLTICYATTLDPELALPDAERGAADVVLVGIAVPPPPGDPPVMVLEPAAEETGEPDQADQEEETGDPLPVPTSAPADEHPAVGDEHP